MQDYYRFIIRRTTLLNSMDPVKHNIITICLKEIRRPTSCHQPKHVLLVAIVINDVNETRSHGD